MTARLTGAVERGLGELALRTMRLVAERSARVGWFATPQGALRFAVRGDPEAPPLLLLHGLGDSLAGWAQLAGPLSQRFCVHLIDLPGHGRSHRPPDWRLGTLTEAANAYARELRSPVVAGHSLGGWIALRIRNASKLALVNPAGALLERAAWEPFRGVVSARDRKGVEAYLERAFHRAPLAMRLFPSEVIRLMWAESAQGILAALEESDFLQEAELKAVQIPVHLVFGEEDRLLPAGSRAFFERALPHARVHVLPGAGHLPHLESPRPLARALLHLA